MRSLRTVRTVVSRAQAVELPFLAAAIAYYALVSVVPALLLAIVVATTLGGGAFAGRVTAAIGDLVTPAGQAAISAALTGVAGRTGASVLGVAVLVWSTLRVFRGLDTAFSRVYGTSGADSVVSQFVDAGVGLVSVGAGLWAMFALGGVLATLPLPVAGWVLGLVALLVGLFAAFLPLYYVFPDVPMTVHDAAPGAALAATGWVGLQAAFQVYAAVASNYELYGVLGGVLLLVTWFYLASNLLVLGAVVNVVLADREDRQAKTSTAREFEPTMDGPPDDRSLESQVAATREAVEALEARLEERVVPRAEIESDLERYVRSRVRRGHARGWGPYLVLLYGTAMTVGAFYLLSGGWAILAMVVVWLSTLGLYVLMVLTGTAIGVLDVPGRVLEAVRERRS